MKNRFWPYFAALALCLCAAWSARGQNAGGVTGWGDTNLTQLDFPPGLTNVVAVSGGAQHNIALRNDGTVILWGGDGDGQISTMPAALIAIRAVAAGGRHTLVLRSNGTVAAWGAADANQTTVPAGLSGVRAIAAGDAFSLALRSNGTVVAWGTVASPAYTTVKMIAAGGDHALALLSNNTVVAWGGLNSYGQLNVPSPLAATNIAAGGAHSLVIRTDGVIIGWGRSTYGQTAASNGLTGARAIFAGQNHSGALKANGTVVCWGDNTFGQRGVPAALTNVFLAASGSAANHSLAVFLAAPAILLQPVSQAVALGAVASFSVGASGSPVLTYQWRKDGTNIGGATGGTYSFANAQPTNAGGYSVVVANSVGSVTSLVAVLTVNSSPVLTAQPQGANVALNSPVDFSVAAVGSAPLRYQWKKGGTTIASATNTTFTIASAQAADAATYTVVVTNLFGSATSSNAVLTVAPPPVFLQHPQGRAVLAGVSVTFRALATNATGYQWQHAGTNLPGATGTLFAINRAAATDVGAYVVLATNEFTGLASAAAALTVQQPATADTEVTAWGQDAVVVSAQFLDMLPPAGLFGVQSVAAGGNHNLVLLTNGTVLGWGDNQYAQGGLPPGLVASAIAAGASHTLVITNGRAGAFGLNTSGQTTLPSAMSNSAAIAAGLNFNLAAQSNGVVFAWGDNSANQTVIPASVTNVMAVAAGTEHGLALRRNGTVAAWGGNAYSQARPPFSVTNAGAAVASIAAGAHHSLALKSNGTVVAWGRGDFGQINIPPEATNIIALATGEHHSMALRRDGLVLCWGQDNYGQTETPPGFAANGIAGGGARGLAVRRLFLRFGAPVISSNQLRFAIRRSDGASVEPARATNIDVFAAADLALPFANWTKLTNALTQTNGGVLFQDNAGSPLRFYRLRERP